MGLLIDHFVAPDDAIAATTIDWVGGPSSGGGESSAAGLPTIRGSGIEPVVALGKLDCLLTARTFDEVLADMPSEPVAMRDGGEGLVLPVGQRLLQALIDSDVNLLTKASRQWASAEEFGGQANPTLLVQFAAALRELALLAAASNQHLYAWVCV